MSLLNNLRTLLQGQASAKFGTVFEVRTTSLLVSTSEGTKEFFVANPPAFPVGTQVKFQGNVLVGSIPSPGEAQVYNV